MTLRTGENLILAALFPPELRSALPAMDLVHIGYRETLYRPGDRITHVYFPLTAMLSMVTVLRDGTRVEVATIGNEGTTGVPLSIPGTVSPILMVCQIPGDCIRFTARAFRTWLEQSATTRDLLDRHSQSLLGLVAQSAACNKIHTVEQRSARWLLMTQDRARSDNFHMTQEFLAELLGVRRASVNPSATKFQRRGMVRYKRGEMEIIDRPALEETSCECYEVARRYQSTLMNRGA